MYQLQCYKKPDGRHTAKKIGGRGTAKTHVNEVNGIATVRNVATDFARANCLFIVLSKSYVSDKISEIIKPDSRQQVRYRAVDSFY